MVLVATSKFFRAQPIMSLYSMSVLHVAILCSSDWSTYLSFVAWVSIPSLSNSSVQLSISYCRISYTYVQVFMVAIALGDVFERTSMFWLELSPVPLTIFCRAMIVVNSTLCYLSQKMHKNYYLAKLALWKTRMEFRMKYLLHLKCINLRIPSLTMCLLP